MWIPIIQISINSHFFYGFVDSNYVDYTVNQDTWQLWYCSNTRLEIKEALLSRLFGEGWGGGGGNPPPPPLPPSSSPGSYTYEL